MEGAILILDISISIEKIREILSLLVDLEIYENGLYSNDIDNQKFLRISAGDNISTLFYSKNQFQIIYKKIKNPYSYLIEFEDFNFFKKCILILWDKIEVIIDNDFGYLIIDIESFKRIDSLYEFNHLSRI